MTACKSYPHNRPSAMGMNIRGNSSMKGRRTTFFHNKIWSVFLSICIGGTTAQNLMAQIQADHLPQLLSSSSTSDETAKTMLRQVITASGGFQLWNTTGSSMLRYRSAGASEAQQPDRLMLDDWSSDKVRYLRGHVGMTGHPIEHDGKTSLSVVSSKDKKKIVTIPEFDQARVLASHLPAAAALVILRSPIYIAKTSTGCEPGRACLAVYRRLASQSDFRREQQWVLDMNTHLPIAIRLLLPDVLRGNFEVWKTVSFSDYRLEQGLQLPHLLATGILGQNGPAQKLLDAKFSVGFDTASFNQEVGK